MSDAGRPRAAFLRLAASRPRLLGSTLAAVLAFVVEPSAWHLATRLLIAWNVGTILDIALNLVAMSTATAKTIRWRAAATDDGKWAILAFTSIAALAAMGAIFAQLAITKEMQAEAKT